MGGEYGLDNGGKSPILVNCLNFVGVTGSSTSIPGCQYETFRSASKMYRKNVMGEHLGHDPLRKGRRSPSAFNGVVGAHNHIVKDGKGLRGLAGRRSEVVHPRFVELIADIERRATGRG